VKIQANVLIIEDSADVRDLYLEILSVDGHTVRAAETAAEGATTEDTAAAAARSDTPPAARTLECFTRPIVPAPRRRVLLRDPRFSLYRGYGATGPGSVAELAPVLPPYRYCKHG